MDRSYVLSTAPYTISTFKFHLFDARLLPAARRISAAAAALTAPAHLSLPLRSGRALSNLLCSALLSPESAVC